MPAPIDSAVLLRPHSDSVYVGHGETVLVTGLDGVVRGGRHGLWVAETRVLSKYEWTVNGSRSDVAGAATIGDDRWVSYFIHAPANWRDDSPPENQASQQTIELRVARSIADGMCEEVEVTNYTQAATRVRMALAIEADFIDVREVGGARRQHGRTTTEWREADRGATLAIRYEAEHRYDHQGDHGVARIVRAIEGRIECDGARPAFVRDGDGGRIEIDVDLAPHATFGARLAWSVVIDGERYEADGARAAERVEAFVRNSTSIETGRDGALAAVVATAFDQAKRDLASMRLDGADDADGGWTFVAGWPTYTAFFGRDTLAASWESAFVSTEMALGTLAQLARSQGRTTDAWRDDEPGRMVHERHRGPLSALLYDPHGRYYGDFTASALFPVLVGAVWRWTGDLDRVRPYVAPALDALAWLDRDGDADGDGFYEYQTHSEQGEENQGWKDSKDAIVYPDGSQVKTPLGTCEMQAFVYAAKLSLSEVVFWTGDLAEARRLFVEAARLKKRFNRAFWMLDEAYVALALDKDKRPVRSIASDAGHCVLSGILPRDRVRAVVARLLGPELFSGWGIRTLSARHPAFDPFAYHRGCVWPVENAAFALGCARYGLHDEMHTIARAQLEAASLFDRCRLPETFAGHTRDDAHPFPPLYPRANWPQAWSASAVLTLVQAMLGIVAYAPMRVLFVDPHLPEWLPEVTVRRLRVGRASVDLRFRRTRGGRTEIEVLHKRGKLHVLRQASPQSLTAGWTGRVRDVVSSLRA